MTAQQIAMRLVDLCRQGQFEKAQHELFANDATSTEPMASPEFEKVTRGLPAIIEKGKKFGSMVKEMHGLNVSDPLVTDNTIAIHMNMDVTMQGRDRENWGEICLYHLKDGKIASEEFYM